MTTCNYVCVSFSCVGDDPADRLSELSLDERDDHDLSSCGDIQLSMWVCTFSADIHLSVGMYLFPVNVICAVQLEKLA